MNQDIIDENDGRLVYTIADAGNLVAIAVAAEREACAKLCDDVFDIVETPAERSAAEECAQAIRARSND